MSSAKPLIFDPASLMFSSFGRDGSLVDLVTGASGLGLKGLTGAGAVGLESHSGEEYITINDNGTQIGTNVLAVYMGFGGVLSFNDSLFTDFLDLHESTQGFSYFNSDTTAFSMSIGNKTTVSNIAWGVRIRGNNGQSPPSGVEIDADGVFLNSPLVRIDPSGAFSWGTASTDVSLKQGADAFAVNTLLVRKGDDSADARLQASSLLASTQLGLIISSTNLALYASTNFGLTVQSGYKIGFTNAFSAASGFEDVKLSRGAAGALLLDDAGTHTPMLQFGGTTSSFFGLTGGAAPDGTNGILAVRADSISTLVAIGCTNVTTATHGFLAVWNGTSGYDVILNGNGGTPYMALASGGTLQWSSTAGATGTPDIILSRVSAGLLGFNATLKNLVAGNETASASGGGATLPGNPVGFLSFVDSSGTTRKIPYYAV